VVAKCGWLNSFSCYTHQEIRKFDIAEHVIAAKKNGSKHGDTIAGGFDLSSMWRASCVHLNHNTVYIGILIINFDLLPTQSQNDNI
jgi:hypothetical protein